MTKIIFTGLPAQSQNLFPFTLTRPVQDIRIGIRTIREKWEDLLRLPSFDLCETHDHNLPASVDREEATKEGPVYLIQGNLLPDDSLVRQVKKLKPGSFITNAENEVVVYFFSKNAVLDTTAGVPVAPKEAPLQLRYPWQIFQLNKRAIEYDFEWLTNGRKGQKISRTNRLIKGHPVFIEKGATVEHCYLNTGDGPIYIGRNALVMEGSLLRGPIAIGEGATVKMGTKIYGATTIGPHCVAGGEIKNAVFFGYSNKAHDGYVGDSVIGEWCNLGAGTSNSNIKNTASDVTVWTPGGRMQAGPKCGMLMGDYSRTSINTAVNTGTVIGVCCNVFGNGLTPKLIPSFSWGSQNPERYRLDKALSDIRNWKALKGAEVTEAEKTILQHIFEH